MPDDLDVQKRILRAELRERRRVMTSSERRRATEGLTSRLAELVASTGADSISCYLSMPSEPAIATIAEARADVLSPASSTSPWVNSRATLSASTGNCRRWLREK